MNESILTREEVLAIAHQVCAAEDVNYYKFGEKRLQMFAAAIEAAVLEKVCGEPIYQTRWDFPRTVWGDVPKADYDTYLDHGYAYRRVVYALTRSKP
ncbi:TPA: hypothetical protein QDB10_003243 [Burkholderia vietnamiensis]|nr:hypothetical protein [Burkholderia vietnamiensis]